MACSSWACKAWWSQCSTMHLWHEDLAHGIRARRRQPHALLLHQHRREEGVGHAHQDAGTITWAGQRAHPEEVSCRERVGLLQLGCNFFCASCSFPKSPWPIWWCANRQHSDGEASNWGVGFGKEFEDPVSTKYLPARRFHLHQARGNRHQHLLLSAQFHGFIASHAPQSTLHNQIAAAYLYSPRSRRRLGDSCAPTSAEHP